MWCRGEKRGEEASEVLVAEAAERHRRTEACTSPKDIGVQTSPELLLPEVPACAEPTEGLAMIPPWGFILSIALVLPYLIWRGLRYEHRRKQEADRWFGTAGGAGTHQHGVLAKSGMDTARIESTTQKPTSELRSKPRRRWQHGYPSSTIWDKESSACSNNVHEFAAPDSQVSSGPHCLRAPQERGAKAVSLDSIPAVEQRARLHGVPSARWCMQSRASANQSVPSHAKRTYGREALLSFRTKFVDPLPQLICRLEELRIEGRRRDEQSRGRVRGDSHSVSTTGVGTVPGSLVRQSSSVERLIAIEQRNIAGTSDPAGSKSSCGGSSVGTTGDDADNKSGDGRAVNSVGVREFAAARILASRHAMRTRTAVPEGFEERVLAVIKTMVSANGVSLRRSESMYACKDPNEANIVAQIATRPFRFRRKVLSLLSCSQHCLHVRGARAMSSFQRYLELLPPISSRQAAAMRALIFRLCGALDGGSDACASIADGSQVTINGTARKPSSGACPPPANGEILVRRLQSAGAMVEAIQRICLRPRPTTRDALFFPSALALERLLRLVNTAKFSIDVCVYCVTDETLVCKTGCSLRAPSQPLLMVGV